MADVGLSKSINALLDHLSVSIHAPFPEHPQHLFIAGELAAISRGNPFLHGLAKARLLDHIVPRCLCRQLIGNLMLLLAEIDRTHDTSPARFYSYSTPHTGANILFHPDESRRSRTTTAGRAIAHQ